MLISQPGSDYQIVSISLDAGYTRDLILLLTDVILSFGVSQCCDLRRPVVDSVFDGTRAA